MTHSSERLTNKKIQRRHFKIANSPHVTWYLTFRGYLTWMAYHLTCMASSYMHGISSYILQGDPKLAPSLPGQDKKCSMKTKDSIFKYILFRYCLESSGVLDQI